MSNNKDSQSDLNASSVLNKTILGIIVARGGSKGLPGKHLMDLGGKPLIAYSIDSALSSKKLDKTILSTDDEEIRQTAINLGVEAPFLRPPEFAKDKSTVFPAIRHAVKWLQKNENYRPEYILLLQAASGVFRTPEDIDNCIDLILEKNADSVVTYTKPKQHPFWMKQLVDDGRLAEYIPGSENPVNLQRQWLPEVYYPTGSVYVAKTSMIEKQDSFYSKNSYPYFIEQERAIDIDSLNDLLLARAIIELERNI